MNKFDIAKLLSEIGVMLELQGESGFKVRAYSSGARVLETMGEDLQEVIDSGRLSSIPGIGKALQEKILEYAQTGSIEYHEQLKGSTAPGLFDLLEIPGIGPKKVRALYQQLNIDTIEALVKACKDGEVEKLSGFGKKTQEKILANIELMANYAKQHLWWSANAIAVEVVEGLRVLDIVDQISVAGSLRRKVNTVKDIDILVASSEPDQLMDCFEELFEPIEVLGRGSTKASYVMKEGIGLDIRVVLKESYASALHHFTGSKEHNVGMRQRALDLGYHLSEWGLKKEGKEEYQSISSEEELFKFLGLKFIDPALRENTGELEAKVLPELIDDSDIRGVFHNHTIASDGKNTLEEMVAKAQSYGWEYLGISDHSKSSVQANGLSEERLLRQVDDIKKLNQGKAFSTYVYCGVECDILGDGTLDYGNDILSQLDYVVASVHSGFSASEEAMTTRIIKAIESPYVTMLGHMTGRLLLRREGYALNVQKVIDAAIANGVVIEINANPRRLDMDWVYWKSAADKGLLTSINPDAHSVDGLEYYKAGVNVAQKGWLERQNILNTWPIERVDQFLKEKKGN